MTSPDRHHEQAMLSPRVWCKIEAGITSYDGTARRHDMSPELSWIFFPRYALRTFESL